ncbi:hypothetical protein C8R43DRAFT_1128178 [Mycena crocata]|nr:hypothetical protein C8R43DRAFT_1128178 [Mycena crocata]
MSTTTIYDDQATTDDHLSTSTPPQGRSPLPQTPPAEFNASTEFEDVPLEPYDGPLEDDDINASMEVSATTIMVPTLKPLFKIGTNAAILARRSEALIKGATAIGKGVLLSAQKASRRLFSTVFPGELDLLEDLLTNVERLELRDGSPVFRVVRAKFQKLQHILLQLRGLAEDSFRAAGRTPQSLPSWGDDEDILEVYDPNAFEILGVCYRVEVENFLFVLDKYYNFADRKPQERDTEAASAASEWIRSTGRMNAPDRSDSNIRGFPRSENDSETKPKRSAISPATTTGSTVRFGPTAPNHGLPQNNRRMTEILNPMAPIFQTAPDRTSSHLPTDPAEAEQMRRMTPQGNYRERDAPPHMRGNQGAQPSQTQTPPGFQRGFSGAPPGGDPDDGDDDDDDERGNPARRRSVPSRRSGNRGNYGNTGNAAYSSSLPMYALTGNRKIKLNW